MQSCGCPHITAKTSNRAKMTIRLCICLALGFVVMFQYLSFFSRRTSGTAAINNKIIDKMCNHSYGVIGIVSDSSNIQLRKVYRKIFSGSKYNNVFIRYLLDISSEQTRKEAQHQGDIIFLDRTDSGTEVKFGMKLLNWFKISTEIFPDAKFVGKMDEDVYICDESFHFVWKNWSSLMYLGWAHNVGWKTVSYNNRMDKMFIVVGYELVQRIIQDEYCFDMKKCGMSMRLYNDLYDDISLAIWLSAYDGVRSVPINDFVFNDDKLTYTPKLCSTYALLHSVKSAQIMSAIYMDQHSLLYTNSDIYIDTTGVSGTIFNGNTKRKYIGPFQDMAISPFKWRDEISCSFWGVVTTVNALSIAIKNVANKMCLVIVADIKTPEETYKNITSLFFVKYLSVKDQRLLEKRGLEITQHIPWNHFGRKNIGYLYAIMHGAHKIFDFDDDNILLDTVSIQSEWYISPKAKVFNPYPSFIHLDDVAWPRGYPLSEIRNSNSWKNIGSMEKKRFNGLHIGVIQSLANNDPDVDAIWRLTRKLPMMFNSNIQIILPIRTMSPYNAQATLHYALWGLLLPISVPGRVTDIWRSYITQRLMWDVGHTLGFVSPLVNQIRNIHNYKADFNGELPLYEKTESLINFLQYWHSSSSKFDQRMLELYIELYERDFIEYNDITLVQGWIRTLKQINFTFPMSTT